MNLNVEPNLITEGAQNSQDYDVIIIGGGPGGYVAAERAGARGMEVLLIEKSHIGGVCLNEGCIPTKTLIHSAKVYAHALESEKFGVRWNTVSWSASAAISGIDCTADDPVPITATRLPVKSTPSCGHVLVK